MSITGTLGGIAVFLIVAFYIRFWTGQILLAIHDSNYVYALCSSAICFGLLFFAAFTFQMPQIISLTGLLLVSPAIAAFVYGRQAL